MRLLIASAPTPEPYHRPVVAAFLPLRRSPAIRPTLDTDRDAASQSPKRTSRMQTRSLSSILFYLDRHSQNAGGEGYVRAVVARIPVPWRKTDDGACPVHPNVFHLYPKLAE